MTLDSVAEKLGEIGNEVHLRSVRDTFETVSPMVVACGVMVLLGQVAAAVAPGTTFADTMGTWTRLIVVTITGLLGMLCCAASAWCLAKAEGHERPLEETLVAAVCMVVLSMGSDGAISAAALGPDGMLAGALVGLVVVELSGRLSRAKHLKLELGGNVPPAVGDTLTSLLRLVIVLGIAGAVETLSLSLTSGGVVALIGAWLQVPLMGVFCGLVVVCVIYAIANLLFCHGLHQATITNVLVKPFLLVAICQNMQAVCLGLTPTNIMTTSLLTSFALIGGSGSTLCLLAATAIVSRDTETRDVARSALAPGLFNINEPVIFGYPVLGEPLLEIPFVGVPVVSLVIAYAATALGVMPVAIAEIPWICPPVLSAFLSYGGSLAAVGVQLLIFAVGTLIYLPFVVVRARRATA